jgi:hypothetical protein
MANAARNGDRPCRVKLLTKIAEPSLQMADISMNSSGNMAGFKLRDLPDIENRAIAVLGELTGSDGGGELDRESLVPPRLEAAGQRPGHPVDALSSQVALFANRIDVWQNGGNAGDRDDGPEGISGLAERG